MFVEAAALAPLGHDGQIILRHVAHEQQDVDVSRFSERFKRGEEFKIEYIKGRVWS